MNTCTPFRSQRSRARLFGLGLVASMIATFAAAQVTTTIFSDSFTTGTSGWYSSAANDITWNSGSGSLTYNTTPLSGTGVNTHLLTYFTPVTLSLGSKLEITYEISFTNVPAANSRSFRVGMFDSGGQQINASGLGQSLSTFNDYDGYRTDHFLNLTSGSTSNPIRFTSRSGTGPSLIVDSPTGAYGTTSSQPTTFGGYYAIQSGVTYMTSYSIERTMADELILTYAFWNPAVAGSGHARAHTLSGSAFYTFDTLAFGVVNTIADSFTLDNVLVTHTTSAIPEPSTYALFGGLGALLAVGLLRRRRAGQSAR